MSPSLSLSFPYFSSSLSPSLSHSHSHPFTSLIPFSVSFHLLLWTFFIIVFFKLSSLFLFVPLLPFSLSRSLSNPFTAINLVGHNNPFNESDTCDGRSDNEAPTWKKWKLKGAEIWKKRFELLPMEMLLSRSSRSLSCLVSKPRQHLLVLRSVLFTSNFIRRHLTHAHYRMYSSN